MAGWSIGWHVGWDQGRGIGRRHCWKQSRRFRWSLGRRIGRSLGRSLGWSLGWGIGRSLGWSLGRRRRRRWDGAVVAGIAVVAVAHLGAHLVARDGAAGAVWLGNAVGRTGSCRVATDRVVASAATITRAFGARQGKKAFSREIQNDLFVT